VIKPIHKARMPLPRIFGIHASTYMQVLYPIPVLVGGYFSYLWAIDQSRKNIGENGEKLRSRRDLVHGNTAKQNEGLGKVLEKVVKNHAKPES